MKLMEIVQSSVEAATGTYTAVKFDQATIDTILDYIADNGIPNGIAASKIHSTVLYSRKDVSELEPLGDIDPPWIGVPIGFDVWGDEKKCLVLKFSCQELVERHEYYMENGGTHDYDDFTPHVTLSYDVGDFDAKTLPKFDSELIIVEEYMKPLELDWGDE